MPMIASCNDENEKIKQLIKQINIQIVYSPKLINSTSSINIRDKIEYYNVSRNHKESYLFLVKKDGHEETLRDPAAYYFDHDGNCVFWDFENPSSYKKKFDGPDTLRRTTKILQTDLPGLVGNWFEFDKDGPNVHKGSILPLPC